MPSAGTLTFSTTRLVRGSVVGPTSTGPWRYAFVELGITNGTDISQSSKAKKVNQPPRRKDEWYRDLTQDPDARREADNVPELRLGFEKLGFRHVGFLGEYGPRGTLWVQEVLTSPRREAFLTLSLSPAGMLRTEFRTVPTTTLESALQDGSIIITTTSPKQFGNLNHPKAGLYLDRVIDAPPEDCWQRHRQRLENLSSERGCMVIRHDSMHLRLWTAERCSKAGSFVAFVALCSGFVAFVLLLVPFLKLMLPFRAQLQAWLGPFWWPLWSVAGAIIFFGGIWISWSRGVRGWFLGQWLARQFPWPRRRRYEPAAEDDLPAKR